MSLLSRSTSFFRGAALLAVVATGAALAQSTPTAFTYAERTGQATNALVTSEARTMAGYTGTLPVSVTGAGNPQYSISGGTYTSAAGSIAAGQTLRVRHTSSHVESTPQETVVAVGEYSTIFRSVTGTTDRTPDAFDFGTKLGTFPNTFAESAPQTLTGFNTSVSITPGSGAQYRIGSGNWTNAGGTLLPGQVLQMRHLTSAADNAYTKTTLTVGGIQGSFTTRNRSSIDQAPIADAGEDQVVDEGAAVTLDGSASSDAESALSYAWEQTGGTEVALGNASTATATFTAPDVAEDEVLTFALTVTDDLGATATDEVQVTVLATRTLSVSDTEVQEGAGTLEFAVTVTPAAARTITVNYATADGTATAADYTGGSGTLTIPAGASQVQVIFPVTQDEFDENDETFTVGLSEAQGATIEDGGLATITIADDDDKGLLRVGAAKRSIQPEQKHIDGCAEPRVVDPSLGEGDLCPETAPPVSRLQKFNLGGFGVNPLQNAPDDPAGIMQTAGGALTEPASKRIHNDEHTQLRAMVVEQPGGDIVVFVMIDAVGAGNVIQRDLKQAVIAAAAELNVTLRPENILFGQTHTHAGADLQGLWGGVPQDWVSRILYGAAAEAVTEALEARQPARMNFRQGHNSNFNSYRRPQVTPGADADSTLTLVQAVADDGSAIGSILQYNAHPTMKNSPRVPHSDYILGAMDWLEDPARFGGVALYYNGPIADASRSDVGDHCRGQYSDAFGESHCRGEGMANWLLDPAHVDAGRELAPTLSAQSVEVYLPVTNPGFLALGLTGSFNRYYNFMDVATENIPGIDPFLANLPQVTPVARTWVSRITLGGAENGLEIVTIPGEATNTFGQSIRALTSANVMLVGLTHNSFGYILPETEFYFANPTIWDDTFEVPGTAYEEIVSLGPMTAPLLRTEGYIPLFRGKLEDQDAASLPDYLPNFTPPWITACSVSYDDPGCIVQIVENDLHAVFDRGLGQAGNACRDFGGPDAFCAIFDTVAGAVGDPVPNLGGGDTRDTDLAPAAADALLRGCDMLDPAYCLFPWPNDHFTAPAAAGSPQSTDAGGTGRRIALNIAAMPRNAAGKPIDPTEWNRNDGFSPGQMIITYVPELGTVKDASGNPTGPLKSGSSITDLSQSVADDASIFIIDVTEGADEYGDKQLAWAEIDLNAGYLLPSNGVASPKPRQAPLIIRPARNLLEGHRYAVVLRNLKRDDDSIIPAGAAFAACLDDEFDSALPPVAARCEHLRDNVLPAIAAEAGVALDPATLFLAWDFTVASAQNNVSRLRHMRDDAFASLGDVAGLAPGQPGFPQGSAPAFTITSATDINTGSIARQIKGTFTVPSYIVPNDDVPLPSGAPAAQGSLPPNRFFYIPDPAAASGCGAEQGAALASCLEQARYGDGLPDRNPAGDLVANFTCNIPKSALSGKDFATADAADVKPARPSLYGHGLLGSHTEGGVGSGNGQAPSFGNEQNVMICATDWFGFASGDLPNVASVLADVSNFPVIPDASQQGVLNFLFLARLMSHPQGFAGNANFRLDGTPVFDTREVFYDGNSQGGILGGPVVAMSKDIQRGVLGVPGMNYSTLLTRSVDFDLYSIPLYAAYPDDLDRSFIFSFMQMLWDRSENNGYAHHIVDSSALNAPDNEVLLHPAFSDHQVSMWTAEVMARTVGARVDRTRVTSDRHPDDNEYYALETLDYGNADHQRGSAFVVWDNHQQPPPPIGNVSPREGSDPHSFPRGQQVGRCQKGHFLQRAGVLVEVPESDANRGSFVCPALTGSGDTDSDGDGIADDSDNCPALANTNQANADGDAQGDACDGDDDNDTVADEVDGCPLTAGEPSNDGCPVQQPDDDGDGVPDTSDNCPADANANQANNDGDTQGDVCDGDDDNDGVADGADQCPTQSGPASNNGCPADETPPFPLPLCEPFTNEYCLRDIPGIGEPLEQALLDAWEAVNGGGSEPPPPTGENPDYGTGAIGLLAELAADLNGVLTSIIDGDAAGAQAAADAAAAHAQENAGQVSESGTPGEALGLDEEPQDVVARAATANRDVEAVVLTGVQLPGWSAPSAMGVANPYPSGAGQYYDTADQACGELPDDEAPFPTGPFPNNLRAYCEAYLAQVLHDQGPRGDQVWTDPVRNAYNGTILYPQGWTPGAQPVAGGVPVGEVAAFRWNATSQQFEEIPVQVDERKPYFLANANSGFSFYSGTDEELSYAWDTEGWGMTKGECEKAYDAAGWDTNPAQADRNTGISRAIPDPIAGLDDDDEVVFMAADAGPLGPTTGFAASWKSVQIVRLNDALDPAAERVIYLVQKAGGSQATRRYVTYTRDADADQWIDRSFYADSDPLKLGTSNTGYGPNLQGTVCKDGAAASSNDRFPRDGVTVTTDTYRWQATGRWMLRDIRVRQPGVANPDPAYWESRQDLVDRWKGRAFQQSPDSTVSLVGFEDEQVNWEANSSLLGERCGPVRCMREVWGADSGTNVTKIETFYRDAVTYRYHVRVHPIPPDGLYTSWDYNRSAMTNPQNEGAEGRYFTVLRPQGVPIDGRNDDVGQVDSVGGFPAFFDASDPTFNLPLAFDNWEQISGKDDLGSLVYLFELKGPTSLLTPAVVPYYRDDACLDDGTGDDPVQRPYPGETSDDSRVRNGYAAAANKPYDELTCAEKQGAHAQHGVHYFFTSDVDNAAMPKPVNEIDGVQWQFMVPTNRPKNVAEPYANVVRVPLQAVVQPAGGGSGIGGDVLPDYDTCVAMAQEGGAADHEAAAKFACAVIFGGGREEGEAGDDEIQGPNTYVAMDDGVLIATNVYVPWGCNVDKNPAARPCASILEMSGYESGSDEGQTPAGDVDDILREETGQGGLPLTGGTRASHEKYYRSGERYVSVTASVRGTGCSAGEFDLFSRKSAYDGYQLVEWMADQHWSNGKVGIFGHSYSGITGAMIASTNPPHLEMVTVSGQIGDVYRDITYPGGVSNYGFPLLWTGGVRPAYDYLGGTFAGLIADSQDRQCAQNQAARSRTVQDDPLIQGLAETDTPWMQERSVVNYLHAVKAPTHITTAYQDEQTGPRGGTHVFDRLPQNLTRRLVTLNGDHGSQTGPVEVTWERRYWMDRFMLDANDPNPNRRPRAWNPGTGLPEPQFVDDGTATSRVLLEVNGGAKSNGHIDSTGFPLAQTQWTDFYFRGDHTLTLETPTPDEASASSTWFNGSKRQFYSYQAGVTTGSQVSTPDASGADELIFALDIDDVAQAYNAAGDTAWVIAGPIMADLYITSPAPDTELMVQLIDADPATGERLYLQRGVLRASHRAIESQHSQCAAYPSGGRITHRECTLLDNIYRPHRPHDSSTDLITPGQVTQYKLEIFPVGHVFRAGHQLLVKVHAPSLDDNDWAYISRTAPALNTLHHSAEYASSLRLPVIPLAAVSRLGGPTATCSDDSMRCVIVAGGASLGEDPSASYREDCHDFGDDNDPTDGVLTNLICGTFDVLAGLLFDDGSGGGEPGPGTAVGEATGEAFDAVADGYQGVIGSGPEAGPQGRVLAGVGVVDMTPDVGFGAGQYTDSDPTAYGFDPYLTGKKQKKSYGVMSRLTGRALVVEGANGKRIALLKSDNYLAQDNLIRRVAQILGENSSTIGYDQILYGVTHAHSTTYASTPSWGVFAFQDAFDARMFEYQARKLATAILIAERDLRPARMGATTVRHKVFKGQIMGPATGDDGTPVQYPNEYGDLGLVVARFDEVDEDGDVVGPIAAWINWGEHPEGLDGYDLHSSDFVGFLERYVDRDLKAPLVFSQGDVGSAEKSGNTSQRIRDDGTVCQGTSAEGPACAEGEGVWRDWNHAGYVQNERNVRFLADAVVKGWKVIGGELPVDPVVTGIKPNNYVPSLQIPPSTSFPVDYRNAFVPGPLSHPYPSVSNCRMETTTGGDPGVVIVGLPDCAHENPLGAFDEGVATAYAGVREGMEEGNGTPFEPLVVPGQETLDDAYSGYNAAYGAARSNMAFNLLKAEGVPVPEHYDASAFTAVEENLRLKLQAFRLGDMVLGSCACEAQVDLILNFESRANDLENDIYDGFDWACVAEDKGFVAADPAHAAACAVQRSKYFDVSEFPTHVPGSLADAAKVARMRAQIHNDARGWDAAEYVPYANAEPADPAKIKGNFTKEELPASLGYKIAVGVGHAGDYNGYTVSYREYMSHDHYRKALTAYGAHTADYMVTRLVRMAGAMRGAAELAPEPHDAMAQADEARMVAESTAVGQATKTAWEGYFAALPPDAAATTPPVQPDDIGHFEAATFTWTGGSTQVDNPSVAVQRCKAGASCGAADPVDSDNWEAFANQTGEVQTRVQWPTPEEAALVYAGSFEWRWTANFEAYEAFPARLGSTPLGTYRFVAEGCINDGSAPDVNLTNRLANFLAGMLPGAAAGAVDDVLAPGSCRGGASPYTLPSQPFQVVAKAPDNVNGAKLQAAGLTLLIEPASIPRSYVSEFFPYLSRGNDFGRFCRECTFRPWAISQTPPSAVSVEYDGQPYPATGSGRHWRVEGLTMAPGTTATITPSYTDGRFAAGHAFTFDGTLAAPDGDHDFVEDSKDNCPATQNLDQADNDGDGMGNACDPEPNKAAEGSSGAPQLCAGPGCISDLPGGEAIQDAVNTAYDTITGLPIPAP